MFSCDCSSNEPALGFVHLRSSLSLPPPLISALLNFFLYFLLFVSLGWLGIKLHFWNPCLVGAELVLSQLPLPAHPSLDVTEIVFNNGDG